MKTKIVDLVIFMGQSNMAGRGVASEAPVLPRGQGYEFRAISDPTKLYPIKEPFGENENKVGGINEEVMKTGSLVSSFVESYYKHAQVPIVAVSASRGGSSIDEWQAKGAYLEDAIGRFTMAKTYLIENGYNIRRSFMVWCQGESDAVGMPAAEYKNKLKHMMDIMLGAGVERCFIIQIGNNRDVKDQHKVIQEAQLDFCKEHEKAILVSKKFALMDSKGLMKDSFHYKQEAYNIVGNEAGENTALYYERENN